MLRGSGVGRMRSEPWEDYRDAAADRLAGRELRAAAGEDDGPSAGRPPRRYVRPLQEHFPGHFPQRHHDLVEAVLGFRELDNAGKGKPGDELGEVHRHAR